MGFSFLVVICESTWLKSLKLRNHQKSSEPSPHFKLQRLIIRQQIEIKRKRFAWTTAQRSLHTKSRRGLDHGSPINNRRLVPNGDLESTLVTCDLLAVLLSMAHGLATCLGATYAATAFQRADG